MCKAVQALGDFVDVTAQLINTTPESRDARRVKLRQMLPLCSQLMAFPPLPPSLNPPPATRTKSQTKVLLVLVKAVAGAGQGGKEERDVAEERAGNLRRSGNERCTSGS